MNTSFALPQKIWDEGDVWSYIYAKWERYMIMDVFTISDVCLIVYETTSGHSLPFKVLMLPAVKEIIEDAKEMLIKKCSYQKDWLKHYNFTRMTEKETETKKEEEPIFDFENYVDNEEWEKEFKDDFIPFNG